jgi:hypothetical protein
MAHREKPGDPLAREALEALVQSPSHRAPELAINLVANLAPQRREDPGVAAYLDMVEAAIRGGERARFLEVLDRNLASRRGQRSTPEGEAAVAALRQLRLDLDSP